MHDDVDAREGRRDRGEVRDVGLVGLDAGDRTAVEAAEFDDTGAEVSTERRTDEAGQARDEDDGEGHQRAPTAFFMSALLARKICPRTLEDTAGSGGEAGRSPHAWAPRPSPSVSHADGKSGMKTSGLEPTFFATRHTLR